MVTNKAKIAHIHIDSEKCIGCKTCLKMCIQDVWYWNEEKGHSEPRHVEDCFYCYQCEMACPAKCIEVVPPTVQYYDAFACFDDDPRYKDVYKKEEIEDV